MLSPRQYWWVIDEGLSESLYTTITSAVKETSVCMYVCMRVWWNNEVEQKQGVVIYTCGHSHTREINKIPHKWRYIHTACSVALFVPRHLSSQWDGIDALSPKGEGKGRRAALTSWRERSSPTGRWKTMKGEAAFGRKGWIGLSSVSKRRSTLPPDLLPASPGTTYDGCTHNLRHSSINSTHC